MDLVIEAGLASRYFVDSPKSGTATLPGPLRHHRPTFDILIAKGELSLDSFSEFLSRPLEARSGFFSRFLSRSISPSEASAVLRAMHSDERPARAICGDLLVITGHCGDQLLKTLEIANMRGYWKTIAVSGVGATPDIQQLILLLTELLGEPAYVSGDAARVAFANVDKLRVVSSATRTVISSDTKERAIIARHLGAVQMFGPAVTGVV